MLKFLWIPSVFLTCSLNFLTASLFAYGQTSSGKSFSMMGVPGTELAGLIPRIANLLFKVVESSGPDRKYLIEASYLEIYNEKCRDLMSAEMGNLKVRESPKVGVHIAGLTKETVNSVAEIMTCIELGTKNRTTSATLYNSESSRSHSIFEINVQAKYQISGEDMRSASRLALIDLAGSERSDKLGSKGKALVEGNNINKSLTVLGRCIRALVEIGKKGGNKAGSTPVPFRDSVLTWYLRDSLAGNARTTMLAACSPVGSNREETVSTLRYASSAKNIKTKATKVSQGIS